MRKTSLFAASLLVAASLSGAGDASASQNVGPQTHADSDCKATYFCTWWYQNYSGPQGTVGVHNGVCYYDDQIRSVKNRSGRSFIVYSEKYCKGNFVVIGDGRDMPTLWFELGRSSQVY
jgi:hypothetical protein